MHSQKAFAPIIIVLGIVVLIGVAGGAFYYQRLSNKNTVESNSTIPALPLPPSPPPLLISPDDAPAPISKNVKDVISYMVPLEWKEEVYDNGAGVGLYSPDFLKGDDFGPSAGCFINIIHRSYPQETHVGNMETQPQGAIELKEIRDFEINGHPASSYIKSYEGTFYTTAIADGKNGIISISLLAGASDLTSCQSTSEQFIKAVRFK